MYAADTILKLKTPRSTPEDTFAYDRVRVIGQSPIDHGLKDSTWTGSNGQGVIIAPLTDFASTIDEPFGRLQRLYDVDETPPPAELVPGNVEIITQDDLGDSPEDVFAKVASESDDGREKAKAEPVKSPLEDIEPPEDIPSDSPFGNPDQAEAEAGAEQAPPTDEGQSPLDDD